MAVQQKFPLYRVEDEQIGNILKEELYILFTGVDSADSFKIPGIVKYLTAKNKKVKKVFYSGVIGNVTVDANMELESYTSFFDIIYKKNNQTPPNDFNKINVIINCSYDDNEQLMICLAASFKTASFVWVTDYKEPGPLTGGTTGTTGAPGATPGDTPAPAVTPGDGAVGDGAKTTADPAATLAPPGTPTKPDDIPTMTLFYTKADQFILDPEALAIVKTNYEDIEGYTKFFSGVSHAFDMIFNELRTTIKSVKNNPNLFTDTKAKSGYLLKVDDFEKCAIHVFGPLTSGTSMDDTLWTKMNKVWDKSVFKQANKNSAITDLIRQNRGIGKLSVPFSSQPSYIDILTFLKAFPYCFRFYGLIDNDMDELMSKLPNGAHYKVSNMRVYNAYVWYLKNKFFSEVDKSMVSAFLGIYSETKSEPSETKSSTLTEYIQKNTLGTSTMTNIKELQKRYDDNAFYRNMIKQYLTLYDIGTDDKLQSFLTSLNGSFGAKVGEEMQYQLVYKSDAEMLGPDIELINKILSSAREDINATGHNKLKTLLDFDYWGIKQSNPTAQPAINKKTNAKTNTALKTKTTELTKFDGFYAAAKAIIMPVDELKKRYDFGKRAMTGQFMLKLIGATDGEKRPGYLSWFNTTMLTVRLYSLWLASNKGELISDNDEFNTLFEEMYQEFANFTKDGKTVGDLKNVLLGINSGKAAPPARPAIPDNNLKLTEEDSFKSLVGLDKEVFDNVVKICILDYSMDKTMVKSKAFVEIINLKPNIVDGAIRSEQTAQAAVAEKQEALTAAQDSLSQPQKNTPFSENYKVLDINIPNISVADNIISIKIEKDITISSIDEQFYNHQSYILQVISKALLAKLTQNFQTYEDQLTVEMINTKTSQKSTTNTTHNDEIEKQLEHASKNKVKAFEAYKDKFMNLLEATPAKLKAQLDESTADGDKREKIKDYLQGIIIQTDKQSKSYMEKVLFDTLASAQSSFVIPLYRMISNNFMTYFVGLNKNRLVRTVLDLKGTLTRDKNDPMYLYETPHHYIIPYCFYTDPVPADSGNLKTKLEEAHKSFGDAAVLDMLSKRVLRIFRGKIEEVHEEASRAFRLLNNPIVHLIQGLQESELPSFKSLAGNVGADVRLGGKKGVHKTTIIEYLEELYDSLKITEPFPRTNPKLVEEIGKNALFYMIFLKGGITLTDDKKWTVFQEKMGEFMNKFQPSTVTNDVIAKLEVMYASFLSKATNSTDVERLQAINKDASYYAQNYPTLQTDVKTAIEEFKKQEDVRKLIWFFSWITPRRDLLKFIGVNESDIPTNIYADPPPVKAGGAPPGAKVIGALKNAASATIAPFANMWHLVSTMFSSVPEHARVFFGNHADQYKLVMDTLKNKDVDSILSTSKSTNIGGETIASLYKSIAENNPQYAKLLGGGDDPNIAKYMSAPSTISTLLNNMTVINKNAQDTDKAKAKAAQEERAKTAAAADEEARAVSEGQAKAKAIAEEKAARGDAAVEQTKDKPASQSVEGPTTTSTSRALMPADKPLQPEVCIDKSTGDAKKDFMKQMHEKQKYKMEEKLLKCLDILKDKVEGMAKLQETWLSEIKTNGENCKTDVANDKKSFDTLNDDQKISPRERSSKQQHHKDNAARVIRQFFASIEQRSDQYYTLLKTFYMKEQRKKIKLIIDYIDRYKYVDPESGEYIPRGYPQIVKTFEDLTKTLETNTDIFYNELNNLMQQYGGMDLMTILDEDSKKQLTNMSSDAMVSNNDRKNKIKSFYRLNYSIMDLLFDTQFMILYVIKAIRIGFTYLALFLTTKVFTPIYEEAVYDKKENPPALIKYLLIYIGFDLAFNVFIFVVLFLLKFLFKTDDNTFAIDSYLFMKYGLDYFISMLYVFLISVLVAEVIMSKKYFKYKYEGLRAIRAYQDIVFYTAIFIFIFPYFWMI